MKKKTGRKKAPSSKGMPRRLTMKQVFASCPNTEFSFTTTRNVKPSHDIIAQSRAIRAINMGLGIRRPGYNIYVAGIEGTGKTSVIRQFLETWSKNSNAPSDWIYVYNFNSPETPRAVELPAGEGRFFRKHMENLVKTFKLEIPTALESEEHENAINSYVSITNERKTKLFSELEKLAKSMDFTIKSSRVGIETIPIRDGRTLSEKDYNKLPEDVRQQIEEKRTQLEPEVLDFARKVRAIEQETREFVEELRGELGNQLISGLMEPLFEKCADYPELIDYLEQVREHVTENLLDFAHDEESEEHDPIEMRDRFNRYKVNLFVSHKKSDKAPIITESNPTYYNLFGKIEKNVENGMYLTDFTMIKSGSIHKANGGYLVIHILDIFRNPTIWDTLKRELRNREGFIEDMGEQYSILPTSGLRPQPIPLDLKVILIGSNEIYHILFDEDEEFHKIFKIKADFDYKMKRSKANIRQYGNFIGTRAKLEDLLHFDRSAVAAIVEHSSRLVEDQRLLSTQFGAIKDLTIEADFIAREDGQRTVKRRHVEEALNQKYYRLNLQEENLLNLVRTEDVLLTVDGERVGQVNGLAVYDYGDYSFGKIGRITCTTAISESGIINIERASHLSGKIHDKGVLILSGFLHGILARERRLGIAASICFEQSYGIIDGDSASVAELVAIISAMSGVSVRQNVAITGSVNQLGDIQSIGGVNEKIEGFYKVCRLIGRKKEYHVVIPRHNVPNLMLHKDVREAVGKGWLRIWPVTHIREAFQLMTGIPLGLDDVHSDAPFTSGSALDIINQKLERLEVEEDSSVESHGEKHKAKGHIRKAARRKKTRK